MSESHQILEIPCISSEWSVGNNTRMHMFIQNLSGTTWQDIIGEPKVVKLHDQNYLIIKLELDTPLYDSERLFGHPVIEYGYVEGDSKQTAYTQGVNERMAGQGMGMKKQPSLSKFP